MDAKNFVEIAKTLPVEIPVLLRGPHGIGKSQITGKQLATYFNLSLLDIRLSQRDAGDVIGLPVVTDDMTRFNPPDWVHRACREPVLLFLDELNRATQEVQQAVFELILDRRMNNNQLHPGTRVYAAVNTGTNYQVNDMDPALLDRFYVCDLEPTPEETIEYFKSIGFDDTLITFLREKPSRLDPSKNADPSKVQPSRRSWERFERAARQSGFLNDDFASDFSLQNKTYHLASGFLGVEIASTVVDYLKTKMLTLKAEDVLDNYEKNQDRFKNLSIDRTNDLVDRLLTHGSKNVWTPTQVDNLGKFIESIDPEMRVSFVIGMMQPSFVSSAVGLANIKAADRSTKSVIKAFETKSVDEDKITSFAEARRKREEAKAAKESSVINEVETKVEDDDDDEYEEDKALEA